MAKTIELEIDDLHELMFDKLVDDMEDPPELEEWAQDTLTGVLYNAYQQSG